MPLNARRYLVAVDRAEMQPGQRVPLHAAAEAAEILTGHAKVDHRWINRARRALVANETHVRDAIAQAEAQVWQRVDGDRRRGFEEEELGAIFEDTSSKAKRSLTPQAPPAKANRARLAVLATKSRQLTRL